LYFIGLACLIFGNFTFVYCNVVAARATGIPQLVSRAALSPAYWVLMSLAASKALLQLIIAPSFWEKTTHGLGTGTGNGASTSARLGTSLGVPVGAEASHANS
jgi:hypothetical protein